MKKLSARGQKWLKAFHIFFACIWIGAGVSLILMQMGMDATDGKVLYGIDISKKFIDDFIIIPGAIGSLVTGLLYSLFTNWGWFKNNWITVKWIINVGGIIFGTFWLGPWLNGCPPISEALGLGALSDPTYVHNKTMNMIWGPVQVGTLVFAAFISVLKPWKKKRIHPANTQ
ncbi:hypothetical protein ACFL4N_01680 [Thermodesulfobacteriota bacterium]